MKLTIGKKLRILLKRKNLNIVELSHRIGTSNQNLANKFKQDNFSTKELEDISEALGCEFEGYVVDKDGDRI